MPCVGCRLAVGSPMGVTCLMIPTPSLPRILRKRAQQLPIPSCRLIHYGCSFEHQGLGHGVSLSVTTFAALVGDVVEASSDPLVIINGHGGNQVLYSLVQELNAHGSRVLLLPTLEHWDQVYEAAGWTFRMHDDMHAGAMERSLLLVWEPERVSDRILSDLTDPHCPLFSAEGMRRYTTGHSGFPSQATGKAGQRAIQSLIDAVTGTVFSWVNE